MGISELTAILCFVLHRLKGSTRVIDNKETSVFFFLVYKCLVILHNLFERGWIMFFRPKAQRWDQQCHSAPKKRKKK